MYRQAHFSFQVSKKVQLYDLWNERWAPWKHKLTPWLTWFCVSVLMLVVMFFRHQLHWLHPPHCLGPCQIYSYPWQALIRDLEWDFAESSRILVVYIYIFYPSSEKKQEAKVRNSYTGDEYNHTDIHTQKHIYTLLLGSLGGFALSFQSM